ncbi:NAD(P)-binding protein [Erwinia oleae]|uniref:NAD(P)-binding protein n=1 Tax=Erwinia oleae TaxID=796334 RepID=UPI0005590B04|nr:NAD(P)-binding protein [Erwinia oleae]
MAEFASFWQAGFEGADHVTRQGAPLSMITANGHLQKVVEDYRALRALGMATVRESVGWRLCDFPEGYDFSSVKIRMLAAQETGVQVCWTVMHYGWPEETDIFDRRFVHRFAMFCGALARFLAPFYDQQAPIYSPVNEISFTSWALGEGYFPSSCAPADGAGERCKRQLVSALLAGCDAIWQADPRARFLHCDPIIHLVAPPEMAVDRAQVNAACEAQYQAWDMIAGRLAPELGGAPRYLDLIGANYYHDNQWEFLSNQRLGWHLGDPRRIPLHQMLQKLHQRYGRPVLLAETSHVGSGRGAWIKHIADEVAQALLDGVSLTGICLYPVVDRPDWDHGTWHHSGLWDVAATHHDPFTRTLNHPFARALEAAQASLRLFNVKLNIREKTPMNMPEMIVFSHLRWDFVFQRPQHLLTRLAGYYRIVFVEEPVFRAGEAGFDYSWPAANITVARPHTSVQQPGFHDDQLAELKPLMGELCSPEAKPVVWFYTPMALPLLTQFTPSRVIYDCMDELSAFQQAPRQLLQRESALLKRADLVFTGGPSLYASKKTRHPAVHCFSSSVDAIHFEQALDRSNGHPLQNAIPHPRLGYYGVIDERLDLELIAALADAHNDWQLIFVGPVVKIDPATLPVRDNIHYLGQQPYQALPQFLAGWDVCLMPFALNDATRFISPTKVLEYMAAELPVVSTAIADVVAGYDDVVFIARDKQAFITDCARALSLSDAERLRTGERMRAIVSATSWDSTVQKMKALIDNPFMPTVRIEDVSQPLAEPDIMPRNPAALKAKYLILGAGPTGLSAAERLGKDAVLLERNSSVGGWCRSEQHGGFTFDYAGHIMFSADPWVLEMYQRLLGDNLHWQNREAWVWSHQTYTRYPFQGALFGLPAGVITECVMGAIEARYETDEYEPGMVKVEDCCADGGTPATDDCTLTRRDKEAKNFEQFIYRTWGSGIAKHFAVPYNKKIWKVPLAEMETSWLGGRVPLPDLRQIISGALAPVSQPVGPNARFGYPLKGGFEALMSGFLPLLKGTLETEAEIVRVIPSQHLVALADGRHYQYEQLISTLPLPALIKMIGDQAPEEIRNAAGQLRHTSIRCVNLGINRPNLTDKHWVYYPENTLFHRIFMQGNASPHCNPPGGFGLTCEISYSQASPLPLEGDALNERCIRECIEVGLFTAEDEVLTATQIDIPCAYVIYDHARERNVTLIRHWLSHFGITLAGRYSEWEYYNSDHAFLAGRKAAEKLLAVGLESSVVS